jgi:hypothetical protein
MTVYSICVLNVLVWIGVLNMSNECGMKECDRQTKEGCIRDRAGRSLADTIHLAK